MSSTDGTRTTRPYPSKIWLIERDNTNDTNVLSSVQRKTKTSRENVGTSQQKGFVTLCGFLCVQTWEDIVGGLTA